MPVAEISDGLEVNVANMKEMIRQVVFAASTDDARLVLTGVLMKITDNHITLATADGFRLSVREADLSSATEIGHIIHLVQRSRADGARCIPG